MELNEIIKSDDWAILADYSSGIRLYYNVKTYCLIICNRNLNNFIEIENYNLFDVAKQLEFLSTIKLKKEIEDYKKIIQYVMIEDLGKITIIDKSKI